MSVCGNGNGNGNGNVVNNSTSTSSAAQYYASTGTTTITTATAATTVIGGGTPSSSSSSSTSPSAIMPVTIDTMKTTTAKLITTRYNREMTLINGDCSDLTKKKVSLLTRNQCLTIFSIPHFEFQEELVARLGKKLQILTNEQATIAEESTANDLLGNDVAMKVTQKIRPNDASKFRSYVDDVGYITMLLLSLSGRLAKTENSLHSILIDNNNANDKVSLFHPNTCSLKSQFFCTNEPL